MNFAVLCGKISPVIIMEQKNIDRLNALAKSAKERELTDEEKDEQQKLRREYIDAYKASLHGVLSNSYIVRPDGTKEKVRRKKPQNNN